MTQDREQGTGDARPPARVFSVTSGKGGVGKTSISVNLAVCFARRGLRTILVDADLGLANTHILAGVRPTRTLSDLLDGKATLAEVIVSGPSGVKLVSGGSGLQEMANLDENGRARILGAVGDLRPYCDVIILDTAAGISRAVTDFVSVSDHALVVTTPDFAAIADAYGIIKTMVQDKHRAGVHLVINRVRSPEEAEQVFAKLKDCAGRFLGFDLNWLGFVPEDGVVEIAVTKRSPFCESHPDSAVARHLARVARSLEGLSSPSLAARTS